MNNKGYVFVPIVVFLLVLATILFVYFKQDLFNSVNQASQVLSRMDYVYYNYSKEENSIINDYKLLVYQNISNISLVHAFNESVSGILMGNNPIIPFDLEAKSYFVEFLNVTFSSTTTQISINYPIKDLLIAEQSFNPIDLQHCLDTADCSNNKQYFESIITSCLSSFDLSGFNLRNSSVPLLIGNQIFMDLELFNNGMTVLFPFKIGIYSFFC